MDLGPHDLLDPRLLGNRLRKAREAQGLTQRQVAERLGLALTTVLAIEAGTQRLSPAQLVGLTELLGCGVSEILQVDLVTCSIGLPHYDEREENDVSARDFMAHAVAAWQHGDLSEGQLARLLKTDRLGAREVIQRFTESERGT